MPHKFFVYNINYSAVGQFFKNKRIFYITKLPNHPMIPFKDCLCSSTNPLKA